MKIIVTGVAGLLGSRFAGWLLENVPGVEVVGIDDMSGGFAENVPAGVQLLQTSLGNAHPCHVRAEFRRFQPDYVFHFAAFAAEGLSPFVRQHTIRNTWLATAEIVTNCIEFGVRRLVFTSSMAVYGAQLPPFDERMLLEPIDPYGVGKVACERDIQIAGEQHGLHWTIIRPHNVYGDQQNIWGDYRNVLGIWMRQALEGKPLRVYGDGSQRRAFSYIDDCLPCFWEAATSGATAGEIINLGGTKPTTILDAALTLAEIAGVKQINHTDPRHEVNQAWSTWQKSIDLIGYQERTMLAAGLAKMWEWACEAWERYPERRNPAPLQYELQRGLYSWWKHDPVYQD